jgi:putative DNA primase/helicase
MGKEIDLEDLEKIVLEPLTVLNKVTDHQDILKKLLSQVQQVNFRASAELEEGENIHNNHYLVITIEHIHTLARANNWGLCIKNDSVYLFNGAFWKPLGEDDIKQFLGTAAEKMGVPRFKARHYKFIDELFNQFISASFSPAPEIQTDKVLINIQNGTYEVTSSGHRLRDFKREDFITYQLPFFHNPTASAPMFQKYLYKVLPEPEKQLVLAEYLGYLFVKNAHLKLEKALILYGSGANGKSVFFEIVNALVGAENFCSYSLSSLTNVSSYQRAELQDKLVNYASEINGKLETSIFKQLVSGERVEARKIYKSPFTMEDYAKLIFNCNELPKEVENTNAYFRRFLIIPFEVTIPDHEQDKQLAKKIIDNELSGIFNWVLSGLNRLLQNKNFSACDSSDKILYQYKTESDSVRMFLKEEGYSKSVNDYIPLKELYDFYKVFCNEDGYHPLKKTNFRKRLRENGIVTEKINIGNVVYISK